MRKLLVLVSILFFAALQFSPHLALAQTANADPSSDTGDVKCAQGYTCLTNPLKGNTTDINVIIGNIIKGVLAVLGSLTLLMMIYGSFIIFTAAGNAEKVKLGMGTILWAGIGTAVVLGAYLILSTFFKYLTGTQ